MSAVRPVRVAMIGHGFMGAAHSQAWRVAPRFFDLPLSPRMSVIVGRDAGKTRAAAEKYGWAEAATSWRDVVTREDIDLVDICSPGDSHAEIAIAALEADKHVLCEKPLANTVEEATAMATAARAAAAQGVRSMVAFCYRRVPAITFAKELVQGGRIGEVRQIRAAYLQDWLADEEGPMTWRLDRKLAGSGALGDIGSHAVDAVQFITSQQVTAVSGYLRTFVTERPLPGQQRGGTGTVTVDDAAWFTGQLSGRAVASFEATRYATGRKNALRLEIFGSRGAVAFDLERMNELEFYDGMDAAGEQGFRRILVTEPEHPYVAAWWPPGHGLGYEHPFSHQVRDLMFAITEGRDPEPGFSAGLQVQRVLGAVERSAAARGVWTSVEEEAEER